MVSSMKRTAKRTFCINSLDGLYNFFIQLTFVKYVKRMFPKIHTFSALLESSCAKNLQNILSTVYFNNKFSKFLIK